MEGLKKFVREAESRYLWYKKELENLHRSGDIYNKMDPEFLKWWKDHLREMKNVEEKTMKDYREEIEYLNQGLNYPFCYLVPAK